LELKLREIRSLQSAGWQHDLEEGEKIKKSIEELKAIMGERFDTNEEVKCFVKNTLETLDQNKV